MKSISWGINEGSILVFAWDHRKPQEHQSESPVPGKDSNHRPPKDKSEASQLQSTCSVSVLLTLHKCGKKEKIHLSAPGINLFKCDHLPIQYNTIQYNTPSKHKNFLHTSSYLIILLISNKALNITKIILPIRTATQKLSVGRIQQAKDYER